VVPDDSVVTEPNRFGPAVCGPITPATGPHEFAASSLVPARSHHLFGGDLGQRPLLTPSAHSRFRNFAAQNIATSDFSSSLLREAGRVPKAHLRLRFGLDPLYSGFPATRWRAAPLLRSRATEVVLVSFRYACCPTPARQKN